MTALSSNTVDEYGWLRGLPFDAMLIFGTLYIALMAGAVVVLRPDLFPAVLVLNLWLLGYHHVIATFTRLSFDRESLSQYRFLVFGLPILVFAATFAIAFGIGIWVIATVYLYWQWFHYTRQSWGISQGYRRKSKEPISESEWFSKASFYLLPAWGILYRSWQDPETFLGAELRVLPVPGLLVDVVGALAIASLLVWTFYRVKAWRLGQLPVAHTCYLVSHYIVFFIGYRLIEDITFGWLVINIWHNTQYILFVWLYNSNRYGNGLDPQARFLSWLSQPKKFLRYFMVCFGIATAVYFSIMFFSVNVAIAGVPLGIVIFQAINFHHYIVDSLIWKMRKKPLQATLGLDAQPK